MPILPLAPNEVSRFWKYVEKSDDCWLWTGGKDRGGYGRFSHKQHTRSSTASRISYALHNGVDPVGIICHTCDNPSCVNPDHLYDGTYKDNAQDMLRRKRAYWQADGFVSKEEQRRQERARARAQQKRERRLTQEENRYGVSRADVRLIRENWIFYRWTEDDIRNRYGLHIRTVRRILDIEIFKDA